MFRLGFVPYAYNHSRLVNRLSDSLQFVYLVRYSDLLPSAPLCQGVQNLFFSISDSVLRLLYPQPTLLERCQFVDLYCALFTLVLCFCEILAVTLATAVVPCGQYKDANYILINKIF